MFFLLAIQEHKSGKNNSLHDAVMVGSDICSGTKL